MERDVVLGDTDRPGEVPRGGRSLEQHLVKALSHRFRARIGRGRLGQDTPRAARVAGIIVQDATRAFTNLAEYPAGGRCQGLGLLLARPNKGRRFVAPSKYQPEKKEDRRGKALCLSGGGYRAALFHLSALRRLNEVGLLSKLDTVSSVSGGSIANGPLAKVWPKLSTALDRATGIFAISKGYTKSRSASSAIATSGPPLVTDHLNPMNWPTLWGGDHSATDFLANTYDDHLLGGLRLKDLAAIHQAGGPRFVFDASNLQTGVNFEFCGDRMSSGSVRNSRSKAFIAGPLPCRRTSSVCARADYPLEGIAKRPPRCIHRGPAHASGRARAALTRAERSARSPADP